MQSEIKIKANQDPRSITSSDFASIWLLSFFWLLFLVAFFVAFLILIFFWFFFFNVWICKNQSEITVYQPIRSEYYLLLRHPLGIVSLTVFEGCVTELRLDCCVHALLGTCNNQSEMSSVLANQKRVFTFFQIGSSPQSSSCLGFTDNFVQHSSLLNNKSCQQNLVQETDFLSVVSKIFYI